MSRIDNETVLAPFEIWEVPLDNSTIKFHKPLVLTPEWLPDDPDDPDENEYLSVKCPELGIAAFGEDRRDLQSCVYGDIMIAWKWIVRAEDSKLPLHNRKIKNAYLTIAEEEIDG